MGFRLLPPNDAFYDLLTASAALSVDGSRELTALLAASTIERAAIRDRLQEIERAADDATHEIVDRLAHCLVPPMDRTDIHDLAIAIDRCVDGMEECADLVTRYRLDVLVRGIEEQVSVVARMADLTHEAMSRLRRPRSLTDYWVEINRLENVANAAHRDVLTELLRPGADPIVVLMEKAVVDALEDAANAFERVADRVESIAVKAV